MPRDGWDKAKFRILVKHCSGDWSDGSGTEREVSEEAEPTFEHDHVSGIHFPKNTSFIAPAFLETFKTLQDKFGSWKQAHPNAKVVVFGHAEKDEEDPRRRSARRAEAAFAFLIGDYHAWGRIAKEEKWGVWEQQHMLQAMGFYQGKIDGKKGLKTGQAIRDFIKHVNETEGKVLNPMLGFSEEYIRLELYRVYMIGKKRAVSIPSSNFRNVSGYPFVGCGAVNRYKNGEEIFGENRRVTFLLISENCNFPVPFPCKSNTSGPCESECGKAGERKTKVFACKHYDNMFASEKLSGHIESLAGGYQIDWDFIAKQEGTRNAMYVPLDADGNVMGISGPTIASGFDVGQVDEAGLKAYGISPAIEAKLQPYTGKQGIEAKEYVQAHPLTLTDAEIHEVHQKVKEKQAALAEAFFNKAAPPDRKFTDLTREAQTAYASVFFQYGTRSETLRKNMAAGDWKASIHTLLHYTTKTVDAKHAVTKRNTAVMQFLPRRCQEATYLSGIFQKPSEKTEALEKIASREKEWEAAYGKSKFW